MGGGPPRARTLGVQEEVPGEDAQRVPVALGAKEDGVRLVELDGHKQQGIVAALQQRELVCPQRVALGRGDHLQAALLEEGLERRDKVAHP